MTVENAIFVAAAAAVGGFILWLAARLADRAEPAPSITMQIGPGDAISFSIYRAVYDQAKDDASSEICARCHDCGWQSDPQPAAGGIASQTLVHAALHNHLNGNVVDEAVRTIEGHQ